MKKPFSNDLGFIGHLLKQDHGITASEDTIWRIICEMTGDRDRAEQAIPAISEGPIELAQLAEAIRNDVNKKLGQVPKVFLVMPPTQPFPQVDPLEKRFAIAIISFALGAVVSFLISHWS